MGEYKFLQPLDEMTRISCTELRNRLDEILDIIDKDNVGYVITNNGKDDLVLCPARWFGCIYETIEFKIDSDLCHKAGEVLKKCGLTLEEAILLFIKETVRLGRIPFEYTQEDILEAKRLSCEVDADGK